jgi:hypothetical protein
MEEAEKTCLVHASPYKAPDEPVDTFHVGLDEHEPEMVQVAESAGIFEGSDRLSLFHKSGTDGRYSTWS